MPPISAEEIDFVTFFECESKMLDEGVPWIYNEALYEFKQGDFTLSCSIAPSYKDVRLIFKCGDQVLYELNAMLVEDIKYHNDNGRETLEVVIDGRDRLWVRLKPVISVSHEVKELT